MIRAWFVELLCVAVIASALLILGLAVGQPQLAVWLGLLGYLGWHLANFLLLQTWTARRKRFRLPLSFGVWEAVFDALQREQLRKRRRRHQLISSLSDYKDAAETLSDGLVVLSKSGAIRWFNPAAGRLLGLDWPAALGTVVAKVLSHPVLEDDLTKGRSSRPLEVPSPANGAWMLSIQVTAPFGDQRERLLLARDVTSVFRLEQARRDFLANVSHELRTPITVFRGYLEVLQEAVTEHRQWREPVSHMEQQARRMQELVDDLLTLSRLEMTDKPPVSTPAPVAEILSSIVAEAKTLSGAREHDLQLSVDPNVMLMGKEADLRSAFSNLIYNAVRHTPPLTRVEVRWQGTAEGATFSVQDHGPGIAAYHLPRLTERFYRVDAGRSRDSGGSGLGLAIVKQVLEGYGSQLKITSQVGQGTTFVCGFPKSLIYIAPTLELSQAG